MSQGFTRVVSTLACGEKTSEGRTNAAGITDILDFQGNTRFALDAIKMKDTAAFFWVQSLVMFAVKWLFYIMLSLVTWDRKECNSYACQQASVKIYNNIFT